MRYMCKDRIVSNRLAYVTLEPRVVQDVGCCMFKGFRVGFAALLSLEYKRISPSSVAVGQQRIHPQFSEMLLIVSSLRYKDLVRA